MSRASCVRVGDSANCRLSVTLLAMWRSSGRLFDVVDAAAMYHAVDATVLNAIARIAGGNFSAHPMVVYSDRSRAHDQQSSRRDNRCGRRCARESGRHRALTSSVAPITLAALRHIACKVAGSARRRTAGRDQRPVKRTHLCWEAALRLKGVPGAGSGQTCSAPVRLSAVFTKSAAFYDAGREAHLLSED
jgi:hypothetical protein